MLRACFSYTYLTSSSDRPTDRMSQSRRPSASVLPFEDLVKFRTATLWLTVCRSVTLSVGQSVCPGVQRSMFWKVCLGEPSLTTVPVCPLSWTVCLCRQYTFALYVSLFTLCTYFRCVSLHTIRTVYTAAVSPDRYTGPCRKLLSYSCKGGFVICTVVDLDSRHV